MTQGRMGWPLQHCRPPTLSCLAWQVGVGWGRLLTPPDVARTWARREWRQCRVWEV